ncbi:MULTISPECIES: IS3 family transposase [Flavobacterium]|uniref:IS3 family transposase n=1 Tax=Flavobacterium ginsenosidimutans TaxID=687844 RepID=A0ABZ2Q7M8_9FLAO|nr:MULTISPECIES: IS3 family transposase [Flavobacterium]WPO76905.1 IS3 family transposase [Flavobacterium sp. KACC 22761]WPO77228.1 IS3 family transposase [Flavobacterium sp. KACC 22761]WPO78069.1 IS3 family transposase [Flavobacterium sp. KACC 22761]WPO79303.1 IS3 family transposase [Flavobacterium sp. KACC 22761]WPO79963.1 IS3 family transposase [Flavobacterium sp. KACC 22761]
MFACTLFGIDRQVYYRRIKRTSSRKLIASEVISLVLKIRNTMPRIGAKKLYYLLKIQLNQLKIGRDKFIDILRANHLLITPRRSYHITTNSHHRFRKHENLILDLKICRPEQVWVSDITYVGKRENPCYLSLITDAYSKKIMGFYVADNMNTKSSLTALKNAIKQRRDKGKTLIHHSDRGLQYCSDQYQKLLYKNNIRCSMTQNSDPYENAVAERINGILKQEFNIDKFNQQLAVMKILIKDAIEVYNNERPHYSNYMLTPNQMHKQNIVEMRTYKTKTPAKKVLTGV